MATPSSPAVKIDDEVLQDWETIGSGGFGQVYRARHKKWGFDVAIKILFSSSPSMCQSLLREADYMTKASKANSFVLNVFGLYEGCPPESGSCKRLGMVIQYMERGSLLSFHRFLSGPLPFPLGFRVAHQVALGMNFLHNLESPLLHQDLKPNNVLLDDNLNAKLADFGLSRESYSVMKSTESDNGDLGGTLAFTPPEGFSLSYRPVRSYDIYSFGILLWCILTGKEPYPGNHSPSMFELRINMGDRPVLTEIDQSKADGLGELVDLMQKCWDHEPSKRPPFHECLTVTEPVFLRHKKETYGCVKQVLSDLDSENNCQPSAAPVPTSSNVQPTEKSVDTVDHGNLTKHENPTHKDLADNLTELSIADKAKFVDFQRSTLIQEVTMVMAITEDLGNIVHPEIYNRIDGKETTQDKMRVLYVSILRAGGDKVKAKFYDALKQHEHNLMDRLGA